MRGNSVDNLIEEDDVKASRLAIAALATWVVRTVLNSVWFGVIMHPTFQRIYDAHPGMFREVIPAFVIADLLFAAVFVALLAKVGGSMGGGVGAGLRLGAYIALIGPAIGAIYEYFSVTYVPAQIEVIDAVYMIVNGAIAGAVAGAVLKSAAAPKTMAAGTR